MNEKNFNAQMCYVHDDVSDKHPVFNSILTCNGLKKGMNGFPF